MIYWIPHHEKVSSIWPMILSVSGNWLNLESSCQLTYIANDQSHHVRTFLTSPFLTKAGNKNCHLSPVQPSCFGCLKGQALATIRVRLQCNKSQSQYRHPVKLALIEQMPIGSLTPHNKQRSNNIAIQLEDEVQCSPLAAPQLKRSRGRGAIPF
jgi:hypothetical protein